MNEREKISANTQTFPQTPRSRVIHPESFYTKSKEDTPRVVDFSPAPATYQLTWGDLLNLCSITPTVKYKASK